MNEILTEMILDISFKVNATEAQKNLAKGLVLKHMIRTDLPNNDQEGTEGYFLNLFNEVMVNLDKLDLKQKLFKNVGLINQIFRIIEISGGEYMKFVQSHKIPKKNQFFPDETLFGSS